MQTPPLNYTKHACQPLQGGILKNTELFMQKQTQTPASHCHTAHHFSLHSTSSPPFITSPITPNTFHHSSLFLFFSRLSLSSTQSIMNTRLLLVLSLSLIAAAAMGRRQSLYPLTPAQECQLQHLSSSQPSERMEFQGGVVELWNEDEDQFQCAGVAPLRITLRPNSLSLPNFRPAPRLVYVLQGQGLLGVTFPGCAETFHSGQSTGKEEEQREEGGERKDLHQKVRRVSQGDIVAIPQGVAHWFFNDGNEDFVTVSVTDLNHQANQLDQKLRVKLFK